MIKLLDTFDITEDVSDEGNYSDNIETVFGRLLKERLVHIADNEGNYSPFGNGILGTNLWQDELYTETDEAGQNIFIGDIKEVSQEISNNGIKTILTSADPMATLVNWIVDDGNRLTEFTVNGNHFKGDNLIAITTGTGQIPMPSSVAFNNSYNPRYAIIETEENSGNTINIKIDRGLDIDLIDGQQIIVSYPVERTIPEAIKQVLVAVGLADNLGGSFDTLATKYKDYKVWINVQKEHNITLKSHIEQLLKMTDMFLTVNQDGVLNLIDGFAYDGYSSTVSITENEIINPVKITYNRRNVKLGWDCLYRSGAGVLNETGNVEQEIIDNTKTNRLLRFVPIGLKSGLAVEYNYLYADLSSASFYAKKITDYYKIARINIECQLNGNIAGLIYNQLNLQLGDKVNISLDLNNFDKLDNETAVVKEFIFNKDKNLYTKVKFELNNRPKL